MQNDFPLHTAAAIRNAFKDTFFYAPAHFAFKKQIDAGVKLEKLKKPRIVQDGANPGLRNKRLRVEPDDRGEPVELPAFVDDELEREVQWVKTKLGTSLVIFVLRVWLYVILISIAPVQPMSGTVKLWLSVKRVRRPTKKQPSPR